MDMYTKWQEPYKRDYILQKRPVNLRSLLIVATPYQVRAAHMITHMINHMDMYIKWQLELQLLTRPPP